MPAHPAGLGLRRLALPAAVALIALGCPPIPDRWLGLGALLCLATHLSGQAGPALLVLGALWSAALIQGAAALSAPLLLGLSLLLVALSWRRAALRRLLLLGALIALARRLDAIGPDPALALFAALALGAALCLSRPRRSLAGGTLLLLALLALRPAPEGPGAAQSLADRGRLPSDSPWWIRNPAAGLRRLAAHPQDEVLGRALVARLGLAPVLQAGWAPSAAALQDEELLAASAAWEARGAGRRAMLLLWSARERPGALWHWARLARRSGYADRVRPPAAGWSVPAGVPLLHPRQDLHIELAAAGQVERAFHLPEPATALRWTLNGQDYQGPPLARLIVDGAQVAELPVSGQRELDLPLPLDSGPHTIGLAFPNDLRGPGGDRNLSWIAIEAR